MLAVGLRPLWCRVLGFCPSKKQGACRMSLRKRASSLGSSCQLGLGFRVQGLGFRVQGLGFRVEG